MSLFFSCAEKRIDKENKFAYFADEKDCEKYITKLGYNVPENHWFYTSTTEYIEKRITNSNFPKKSGYYICDLEPIIPMKDLYNKWKEGQIYLSNNCSVDHILLDENKKIIKYGFKNFWPTYGRFECEDDYGFAFYSTKIENTVLDAAGIEGTTKIPVTQQIKITASEKRIIKIILKKICGSTLETGYYEIYRILEDSDQVYKCYLEFDKDENIVSGWYVRY